jgi:hypothetical protein
VTVTAQTEVLLVAIVPHAAAAALLPLVAAVATLPATRMTGATATTTDAREIAPGVQTATARARMTVTAKMTVTSRTTVTAMKSARVCYYYFATTTTLGK